MFGSICLFERKQSERKEEDFMGGSSWSTDAYKTRVDSRVAATGTAFAYHADVTSGRTKKKAHDTLDPKGLKIRESRDSANHPESNAVAVVLDVTGSMGSVITAIHEKLPTLMGILTRKAYISDPQIMFMAVGDATTDSVPLQVGQFESGDEMEGDVSNMFLEGGGGGQMTESYELGAYVLARKTSIDCFEKRGKKGFVFFIGDETPYAKVDKNQVDLLIGKELEQDVSTEKIFQELQEKYVVFLILPAKASNGGIVDTIRNAWGKYINPQHVLVLQDASGVSELIAAQIGLYEGADLDGVTKDLTEHGTSKALVAAVHSAVSRDYVGGAIAKVPSGSLTPSDGPSSVKRL